MTPRQIAAVLRWYQAGGLYVLNAGQPTPAQDVDLENTEDVGGIVKPLGRS